MSSTLYVLSIALPIAFLLVTALGIRTRPDKSRWQKAMKTALLLTIIGAVLAGIGLWLNGTIESGLLGLIGLGINLKLDTIGLLMYTVVAVIGYVVFNYSLNYLDGDDRQYLFLGRLGFTVSAVLVFLLTANIFTLYLAWVAIGRNLDHLILFYPNRPKAKLASKKKNLVTRISNQALLVGFTLLFFEVGSGNLTEIFAYVSERTTIGLPIHVHVAAFAVVLAAMLQAAQLPFHGWIIDIMEAPTPVSALLHAGLLNAGPFLVLRFSPLVHATQWVSIVLFTVGVTTAVFGSLVFVKQTAIKTSLAYSSVAHMGFTLLLSGLGVYAASMLHLMAHSFYKAHAFLSSGSIIDKVRTNAAQKPNRKHNPIWIVLGIALPLTIVFGIEQSIELFRASHTFHYTFVAFILILGLMNVFINAIDSNVTWRSMIQLSIQAVFVVVVFFSLEAGIRTLIGSEAPTLSASDPAMLIACIIAAMLFTFVVLIQNIPGFKRYGREMNIHLRNGLYLSHAFDRIIIQLEGLKARKMRR